MAASHSIPPFPADIDRDAFGHWLSGFADGEGCFYLGISTQRSKSGRLFPPYPITEFSINLRSDDVNILKLIRSYMQCGIVLEFKRSWSANAHPASRFDVAIPRHLANCVVPHFEKYPLRAKKTRDFAIWKCGVCLAATVARRRTCGGSARKSKWLPAEREEFSSLIAALRQQREYQSHKIEIPRQKKIEEWTLFDNLQ